MADSPKPTTWDDNLRRLLESYKWPIVCLFVLVALNQGWVDVPILDWLFNHVERIIRSATGG